MTAFSAAQSVMNTMSNMGGMLKPLGGKQDQPPARPAPTPGQGANPLIPQ